MFYIFAIYYTGLSEGGGLDSSRIYMQVPGMTIRLGYVPFHCISMYRYMLSFLK